MTTLAKSSAVTLTFTKFFKKGMLKGIRAVETMPFTSEASAQTWLKGVAANYKRGALDYVVENPIVEPTLPKGFIQWANEAQDAFYWTNGKDVFRSSVESAVDVTTGYTAGRWESTVQHWNHFAGRLGRKLIG